VLRRYGTGESAGERECIDIGHRLKIVVDRGAPLLIDTHGAAVPDIVWALFRRTIARTGPRPTLIEWDNDVPAFAVLATASGCGVCADRVKKRMGDRVMDQMADLQTKFSRALLDPARPIPSAIRGATRRKADEISFGSLSAARASSVDH
jgi:hypothetical protein